MVRMSRILLAGVMVLAVPVVGQTTIRTQTNTGVQGAGNQSVTAQRAGVPQNQNQIQYYYRNRPYTIPYQRQGIVAPLSGTVIVPTPARPRVVGNVAPYSETEYGQVVLQQIQGSLQAQGGDILGEETSVTKVGADEISSVSESTGLPLYQAYVEQVTPDGVFHTANGKLVLRGVRIQGPGVSERGTASFGVAVALLKQLAEGKDVFYTVGKPEKNSRNQTLAIIHTEDGTELNRVIVESGYGELVPTDFANPQELQDIARAEAAAKSESRGVWQASDLPVDVEPRETPAPLGTTPTPTPEPGTVTEDSRISEDGAL